MELIIQGAEAKIFRDGGKIIKDRIEKRYRIKAIDAALRKSRTRREEKIYKVLEGMKFPAPRLLDSDGMQKLTAEFIPGSVLRDILEKSSYRHLCQEIGKKIAALHNAGIIHGDLTTSNMILKEEIYFIDFGLSFFSQKAEDKATDLHLLKEALESTHPTIWESCFENALEEYRRHAVNGKETIERLKKVEQRGRYKGKGH